tara:strand:+ start:3965 stop:4753 length:789 start_codon:yes stop_codon:yes gene_type:complete
MVEQCELNEIFYSNSIQEIIDNQYSVKETTKRIKNGDALIVRSVYGKDILKRIREYLTSIGKSSLPYYQKIEKGCPNNHRVVSWDRRSYTQACFHQFSFFPWNQDVFNLFEKATPVFQLKNLLSGLPMNKFLGTEPEDGCIARLSFQFYPSGMGAMNKHRDPVDSHQLTVPLMLMNKIGADYCSGGGYGEKADKSRVYFDDLMNPGDVLFINARVSHGVEIIDSEIKNPDWLDFAGRWTTVFAVNKLHGNTKISNAIDQEAN